MVFPQPLEAVPVSSWKRCTARLKPRPFKALLVPDLETFPVKALRHQHQSSRLNWFSAKEIDQFDNKNNYHQQFEHEGPALIELVDHETIQFLGGLHFLGD